MEHRDPPDLMGLCESLSGFDHLPGQCYTASMPDMDPVTLEIFRHLFASVAEEMGATLGRTGFSPNIKERRDFSCAVFDADGRMLALAAHIPVHLGAMPASVRAAMDRCSPFRPGDCIILNDPFLGGTHLPDITLVSPVFLSTAEPAFFVANRAHHADIGGAAPGSMPLAREIYAEGLILPPIRLVAAGQRNEEVWQLILRNVRTPDERQGDLIAQLAAQQIGARRLAEIVARYSLEETAHQAESLIAYTQALTRKMIEEIPDGIYAAEDALDDGTAIRLRLTVTGDEMEFDFAGSSAAVEGPLNAVRAIVESAVLYVLRCLAGDTVPANAGMMIPLRILIPRGSVLDAQPPHAVAGGNVETSQRVVDVILAALALALPQRIPAASQGTMNNLTFGGRFLSAECPSAYPHTPFAYYETIGGGVGAGPSGPGESGMHSHMTNTLNTPIEALESQFPVRLHRYAIRRGSGGIGQYPGGDGLCRDIEFLAPAQVTVLSERRILAPPGRAGGTPGRQGENVLQTVQGDVRLPGQFSRLIQVGEILCLRTPGGGGWGQEVRNGD